MDINASENILPFRFTKEQPKCTYIFWDCETNIFTDVNGNKVCILDYITPNDVLLFRSEITPENVIFTHRNDRQHLVEIITDEY